MDALYSAALGPIQGHRNRTLLAHLDPAGRARLGWNWAASLTTLSWMALHYLWTAALIYVAALEGVALLVFGAGRNWLNWPESVQWGLIACFVLFVFALPGLFGDTLLHNETRKRIAYALATSRTMPEACALLSRQASSKQRVQWIALVNLAILAVLTALWFWMPTALTGAAPTLDTAMETGLVQHATRAAPDFVSRPTLPDTAAQSESALPAAPVPPAATAPPPPGLARANLFRSPSVPTSASTSTQQQATETPKTEEASAAAGTLLAATMTTPAPTSGQSAAGEPSAVGADPAETPSPSTDASRASTAPVSSDRPAAAPRRSGKRSAPVRSNLAPSPPVEPAQTGITPRDGTTAQAAERTPRLGANGPLGSAPGYYLNVGVFTEDANARRAQAQLLNANLPAFRNRIETKNGPSTRVRVGPFTTEAGARKAATATKALGLDAVMYRQSAP